MGDQDISYFDTFVDTYNSIGGSAICEEIAEKMAE